MLEASSSIQPRTAHRTSPGSFALAAAFTRGPLAAEDGDETDEERRDEEQVEEDRRIVHVGFLVHGILDRAPQPVPEGLRTPIAHRAPPPEFEEARAD